jgi:hypothetical protein
MILGMEYSEKADVFAYGIVLAEIITRKKASRGMYARSNRESLVSHKTNNSACALYVLWLAIFTELQRGPQNCFEFDVDAFKALVPDDCPPALAQLAISW